MEHSRKHRFKHWICDLLDGLIRRTPQCEHLAATCTSLRQRWAEAEDKLSTEQRITERLQSDLDSTTAALVAERARKKKRPVRK